VPLNPPRDPDGVIPHDDPAIPDDSYLVRHINPTAHVSRDEETGGLRVSSGAFSKTREPRGGVSVDLGHLLAKEGKALDAMVPTGFGAVKLRVAQVRELALQVGSDALPANPYHGQIWGASRKTSRDLNRIIEAWLVPLPGVYLR
jgi:hypothetical protein